MGSGAAPAFPATPFPQAKMLKMQYSVHNPCSLTVALYSLALMLKNSLGEFKLASALVNRIPC